MVEDREGLLGVLEGSAERDVGRSVDVGGLRSWSVRRRAAEEGLKEGLAEGVGLLRDTLVSLQRGELRGPKSVNRKQRHRETWKCPRMWACVGSKR